jgi:hypothetical protein
MYTEFFEKEEDECYDAETKNKVLDVLFVWRHRDRKNNERQ